MSFNSEKELFLHDDVNKDMSEDIGKDKASVKRNNKDTKVCKVASYDNKNKILHVIFDNWGIQIPNIEARPKKDVVTIEYHGKIGSGNFSFKLK